MDALNRYRNSQNLSSDDDDDSDDSDKECNVWKRATVKRVDVEEMFPKKELEVIQPPEQAKPRLKRKINTVWSEVLEDQLISEDFEDCLLKNKPRNYGSRGKESYDYTLRYEDKRDEIDSDSHMSDISLNDGSKSDITHSLSHVNKFKKFMKLDNTELDAARKINKVLNEKKVYLIQRIVKVVGIEKAMTLLNMTEQIEDCGGMMIKSNTRRRTPGGVYIQLLKNDKEVTQEMLDKIFEGEMTPLELKNYYAEKKKNKKKHFGNRKNKQKRKGNLKTKEIANTGTEQMESEEMVSMDAEVAIDVKPEKPSSGGNVSSCPIIEKKTPENTSDLEEGEIED